MADNESRKLILEKRIVDTVLKYFEVHKEPVAIRILAAKFAKALLHIGEGFPEVMADLEARGIVRIEVRKSGAQFVYPPNPNEDDANYY